MRAIRYMCGVSVLMLAGCGGAEPPTEAVCGQGSYPSAPEGASGVLHVSAACATGAEDGSTAHPFGTIGGAIAHASKGGTVLIAPGKYAENLALSTDISLVGSSSPDDPGAAGVELAAAETSYPIVVTAGTVLIQGFHIAGGVGVGIQVKGGTVTITASRIEGTKRNSDNQYGYGVATKDDAAIILQHSVVTGSAAAGVFIHEARAIILQDQIGDNAAGGVRIEHASGEVQIKETTLANNAVFGVGVFSSKAIILQSTISDTKEGASPDAAMIADGIVVAKLDDQMMDFGPSDLTVKDTTIAGCGRAGLLFSGAEARGIILQNNTISGNGVTASFGAGIWLQAGAGSGSGNVIEGNHLTGNRFVGLGATGDTHGIILQNNEVTGTTLGSLFVNAQEVQIGDGMFLSKGASAKITGNTISGNQRFGLILDSAKGTATSIESNTIQDNDQYGIILQNQPSAPATDMNTFGGNASGDVDVPAVPFLTQSKDFAL